MATVVKQESIQRQLDRYCEKVGVKPIKLDVTKVEMDYDIQGKFLTVFTKYECYDARTMAQLHQLSAEVTAKGLKTCKQRLRLKYTMKCRYFFSLHWN